MRASHKEVPEFSNLEGSCSDRPFYNFFQSQGANFWVCVRPSRGDGSRCLHCGLEPVGLV